MRGLRYRSGEIRGGTWDLDQRAPVDQLHKVRALYEHWRDGSDWEATGIIDYVLDGIGRTGRPEAGATTRTEVVARYSELDRVFEQVREEGRLRTRNEVIGARAFRERGGINCHIARDGEILFGNGGTHRLVMAQVLALPVIPICVGVVHSDAVRTGAWRSRLDDPR